MCVYVMFASVILSRVMFQPPKAKKGKKSKKSKAVEEAERAAAEEAARIAAAEEEARLEEERAALAAEKERLRAEEDERLRLESIRLSKEREEMAPFFKEHARKLAKGRRDKLASVIWARYTSCTTLPDPSDARAIAGFLQSPVLEVQVGSSAPALLAAMGGVCSDLKEMLREARYYELEAQATQSDQEASTYAALRSSLLLRVDEAVDEATAAILARPDEYAADDEAALQLESSSDTLSYGLWVNMVKNPRLKSIEFKKLDTVLELPKPIALATVALRLVRLRCDTNGFDRLSGVCTNDLAACGGVLSIELMSLSPPPKHVKGWTIRHAGGGASRLNRQAYPIPPAGGSAATTAASAAPTTTVAAPDASESTATTAAAASTGTASTPGSTTAASDNAAGTALPAPAAPSSALSQAQRSAPPVGVSIPLPSGFVVPGGNEAGVRVGWWDGSSRSWITDDGITDIKVDLEKRRVSFFTGRLAPLAVVRSRCALLPYSRWHVRPRRLEAVGDEEALSPPMGGVAEEPRIDDDEDEGAVVLTVYVPTMTEPFVFYVTRLGARLLSPRFSELDDGILDTTMQPRELLMRLRNCGLNLLPSDRDQAFCSNGGSTAAALKTNSLERVVCEDISLIVPACQVGSSTWNRSASCGAESALFRMSEIVDGVRVTHDDVERVFAKDKAHVVSRVMRQEKGAVVLGEGAAAEAATEWDADTSLKGRDFHASSLMIARQCLSESGVQRVEQASPIVANNVKDLMHAMRLFSFG